MGPRKGYAAGPSFQSRRVLLERYPSVRPRSLPTHAAARWHLHSAIACVVGGAPAGRPGEAAGDHLSHGTAVFDHVFAAALLVTFMVATAPASPVPVTVKRLVRNRRTCAHHHPHPALAATYCRSGDLRAGNFVRHRYRAAGDHGRARLWVRACSILEAVAGIVVLGWLWLYGAHRAAQGLGQTSNLRRLFAALILFVLTIGLVAAGFRLYAFGASDDTRCFRRRRAGDGGIRVGSGGYGCCCGTLSECGRCASSIWSRITAICWNGESTGCFCGSLLLRG